MLTLAIETSCDETAVALYGRSQREQDPRLLSSLVFSQIEVHRPYGGVVPELASRNHALQLAPLVEAALSEAEVPLSAVDVFAATIGPGLSSALLIGATYAKALAVAEGKTFLGVNHMEGHLWSPFLESNALPSSPFLELIISGGHTLLVKVAEVGSYKVLGRTRDDAVGEAYDKVAKMLGLPYPGGPEIERYALKGNPNTYLFPRALTKGMLKTGNLDFSFSGLKTAVLYALEKFPKGVESLTERQKENLCASFQFAISEVLIKKTLLAAKLQNLSLVALSGGVSANRYLTQSLREACECQAYQFQDCPLTYSTDNAAMIAFAAYLRYQKKQVGTPLNTPINPNLSLDSAE